MSENTQAAPDVDEIPVYDTAPKVKPEHFVAGDTFFAQTSDGELSIPLRFKTKLIRQIREVDGDELDQMFALLDGIGDKATANALDELDIFETTRHVQAFFRAWQERNQASVGEARRSSN